MLRREILFADRLRGDGEEGKTPKRVSVPFQYGRPARFRARPSSLHSQQGAATVSRVFLGPGSGRNLCGDYRRSEEAKPLNRLRLESACPPETKRLNRGNAEQSQDEVEHLALLSTEFGRHSPIFCMRPSRGF